MCLSNVITIDASIAAGKSTVMRELARLLAMNECNTVLPREIDLEPVEVWEPYLTRAYHDKAGWFRLQMRVIRDRMWPRDHCWVERSLFFQERAFVHAAIEDGRIAPEEVTMIKDLYSLAAERWQPRVYVYLRSCPAGCFERMHRRARASESAVPLAYLAMLHERHERALEELLQKKDHPPVVVVEVEGKTPATIAAEIIDRVEAALALVPGLGTKVN